MTTKHLGFMYGTLKNGHGNNYLLRGRARFVAMAETVGKYLMFDNGFPYVVDRKDTNQGLFSGPETGHVKGEVWEFDDAVLKDLDRLEGVPNHYRRETTDVKLSTGQVVKVNIYICNNFRFSPHRPLPLIHPDAQGTVEWPAKLDLADPSEEEFAEE